MSAEDRVSTGEPLCAADAAFLEDQLASHGIEASARELEDGSMVVEVAAGDRERAIEVRQAALVHDPAAEDDALEAAQRARRKRLLFAAIGAVFVLYVGRGMPPVLRGLGALIAAAVGYLVVGER